MKRKKITINSQKDYQKFLKKILIYKSVLYINTNFYVSKTIKEENISYIINALNIKSRKKRINYVYDKSCSMIDDKNKGINICGFKNHICYAGNSNGCCRYCLYITNKGCSTKNLACKLFNCSEVTKRYNTLKYDDIKLLKVLSLKNRFIVKSDYFSKREDVLKDLYSFSIIYSTIRIIYRLIKNHLKK